MSRTEVKRRPVARAALDLVVGVSVCIGLLTACNHNDDAGKKYVVQLIGTQPDREGLYKVVCWIPDTDKHVVKNWNIDTQPRPIIGDVWLCNA